MASLSLHDGQSKVSKRVEKELHNTKVVVRRLPPDMTEETLFETFTEIPEYNFFYFASSDPSFGELATSRAYFSFTEESSIIPFRDKYDGLPLESSKGLKYRAVIEFAPYQGIPKRTKKKPDSRTATIEQDQDYLSFKETAHDRKEPLTMAEIAAYAESLNASKVHEMQMTPLVSYLLERRRGGRSSKRPKPSSGEAKKKRSKEGKLSKESRPKGQTVTKSSSSGSKEWTGKGKKERSGKKSDIDATSSSSLEGRSPGGGSERVKDKGKWKEEGKGKSWKDSKVWWDENSSEVPSERGSRQHETGEIREGKREKHTSKSGRRSEDGIGREDEYSRERGGQRDRKSTRRSYDEERKPKPSGVRNRDRPDQAVYVPRSRPRGDYNHTFGKTREGSSDGHRPTKEKRESSYDMSGRSEGWKRKDQMNGEKHKYGEREDGYAEGGGERSRSGGSRRGKSRHAGYSDSSPSYYDK